MYLFNLAISIWNLFCDCSTKGKSNKKQNILAYGSGAEEDEDGDDNGFEIDDYDVSD